MINAFDNFAYSGFGSNQVDRTTPVRLSDIRNVKDFGAVGDGVTDDWAAIIAALQRGRYFVTASATNKVATFTGVVNSAFFVGSISGTTLTVTATTPVGTCEGLFSNSGVTSFNIVSGSGPYTISGSAQNVGPVAMKVHATGNPFTGTIVGNTLTVNQGYAGTIAVNETITSGATSCMITAGSGLSWTVNVSQTVGPNQMLTNTILMASSVTASIAVGDRVLNNGGTDASPSTLITDTQIASQQSGSAGGAGVYVVTFPEVFQSPTIQNFTSQSMMTVSTTVSLSSAAQVLPNQYAYDVNNSTVSGDGYTGTAVLNFTPPFTSIAFTSMGGLVNAGDSIGIDPTTSRGTVYFPPGTYKVSQPIDYSASQADVCWIGSGGSTTITANFNDYVFKQTQGTPVRDSTVEGFTIINTHATGGGIRSGGALPGVIRRCNITANRGMTDYNQDTQGSSGYSGSFEFAMEDCVMSPGSNVSGSIGIMRQSDGPVTNCRVIGYEIGFQCAGGEGAQVLLGDYFEQCGTAIDLNRAPDGGSFAASGVVIAGCHLKNNSIGINCNGSAALITCVGVYIEGANGQAPGGLNPQYGILNVGPGVGQGFLSQSMVAGVTVVGSYDVAGIYSSGKAFSVSGPVFMAVADAATSPNPFKFDPTFGPYVPTQIACNARYIYTVANLPSPAEDQSEMLNVSDGTNGLAWGAIVTNTGTHTTPYLVQWNGANWTVMGK